MLSLQGRAPAASKMLTAQKFCLSKVTITHKSQDFKCVFNIADTQEGKTPVISTIISLKNTWPKKMVENKGLNLTLTTT